MAIKFWRATSLTGGTVGSLDSYKPSVLSDGDVAFVNDSWAFYVLQYDSSSTAAENSPNYVRPDDFVDSGVWRLLSINQAANTPSSGVVIEGCVWGLDYEVTDTNEVTVSPGNCMSSDNSTFMSLETSQAVDTSAVTTANVAISLFLCSDGVVRYDEDETGATLLSAYTKRWIGFVKNTATGELNPMEQRGNLMSFTKATDVTLAWIEGTSYSTLTGIDVLLPESRLIGIEYGVGLIIGAETVIASDDGVYTSFVVGRSSTASGGVGLNAWGDIDYQKMSMKVYSPDRQFKCNSTGSAELLVHSVLMRR